MHYPQIPVRAKVAALPYVFFVALGLLVVGNFDPASMTAQPPAAAASTGSAQVAKQAVKFALAQRGKPYRWGTEGPSSYDCSGLTWAAWRSAGVAIPRTATAQLAGLPRAAGKLKAGDLVVYATNGPSRRHVAMVVAKGRMIEARGRGIPVRVTSLRRGWLGAVRPISPMMTPSRFAKGDIPHRYLPLYQKAGKGEVWKTRDGKRYATWAVLAAIGKVETNHGRMRLPGVRSGLNRYRGRDGRWHSCCAGPMQFNLVNGPPSTWRTYGHGNVYDPADAIPAARRLLIANGAQRDLSGAIWNYNHSSSYVANVRALARRYQKGA